MKATVRKVGGDIRTEAPATDELRFRPLIRPGRNARHCSTKLAGRGEHVQSLGRYPLVHPKFAGPDPIDEEAAVAEPVCDPVVLLLSRPATVGSLPLAENPKLYLRDDWILCTSRLFPPSRLAKEVTASRSGDTQFWGLC